MPTPRTLLPTLGATLLLAACDAERPLPETSSVVVRENVAWPAAARLDRAALASLDDASRAAVARAPVPVLVPHLETDEIARGAATIIVEPEYYAVSLARDGVTIAVQGTRTAHRYASIAPHPGDRKLRGVTGFVTENEGIRSASWIESGVAYSLDVECSDTVTDARCQSDAFVTSLVESLVYVGGRGR